MAEELFLKLTKIEEASRTVWGIATAEKPDLDNEICDYPSAKAAYQSWSKNSLEKTTAAGQEPSLGNVRIMHGNQIGGKVTAIEYDDMNKVIRVASTPANDEVWRMLTGGFLTGYSHGGKKNILGQEGRFRRYAPMLAELSYVDKACLDEGFEFVKSDGSTELRKFTHSESELSKAAASAVAEEEATWAELGITPIPEAVAVAIYSQSGVLTKLYKIVESDSKSKANKEQSTMNEKEKQEFEEMKKGLETMKKMSEAHLAHLQSINTHLDGAKQHLIAMCDGEKMAKVATAETAPTGFVSAGKTTEGVEIFKKAPVDPNAAAIEALTKRLDAADATNKENEKLILELNKGIVETLTKGVKIPGVANAAGLAVVAKEKDGAAAVDDKTKKTEDLKKFSSSEEMRNDPELLKSVRSAPMGSTEMEFFANRAASRA